MTPRIHESGVTDGNHPMLLAKSSMSDLRLVWLLCSALSLLHAEDVPESPWPIDIPGSGGVVTLYQPQPETLPVNVLTGRWRTA